MLSSEVTNNEILYVTLNLAVLFYQDLCLLAILFMNGFIIVNMMVLSGCQQPLDGNKRTRAGQNKKHFIIKISKWGTE